MIHPAMMTKLKDFFPESCDIYTMTDATDGETESPTPSIKFSSIDAVLADASRMQSEIRRKDGTLVLHPYIITLRGKYAVTEKDRAVIAAVNYDILSADFDSRDQMTRLKCEVRS